MPWLDDTHAFNEHQALEKGYNAASVQAIGAGLQSAAARAQSELATLGKWVYHFVNNVEIPHSATTQPESSLLGAARHIPAAPRTSAPPSRSAATPRSPPHTPGPASPQIAIYSISSLT